ncbi:hypothetical protein YC2023_046246 [Brassica napus]
MLLQVSNIFIQQFQKASRTSGGLNGFKKMKEFMHVDCQVYQGNATIMIKHLTDELKPLKSKAVDRVPGGAE